MITICKSLNPRILPSIIYSWESHKDCEGFINLLDFNNNSHKALQVNTYPNNSAMRQTYFLYQINELVHYTSGQEQ
jgi:hypothetical protein